MARKTSWLVVWLLVIAAPAIAHPLDYRIDTVHSQILFSVDHDGYSKPVGRLAITRGWLRFDPDDWGASKVVADIDPASVDLGDKGWDAAVTGHNFLDADKFPFAHFESTSVTQTGKDNGVIDGQLTLHGVTLPVKVDFTVNRVGMTLFGFETIAGFSGHTQLDRTRFGMTAFPKAIGTDAAIRLEIEAKLDRQAEYDYRQAEDKSMRGRAHAAAQH
jgi:polyisoprenoid-binding protein YceI